MVTIAVDAMGGDHVLKPAAGGWIRAGKIPGVDRPALSAVFPTKPGGLVVLVDVGANVDCSPEMLAQFAVMGEIYSRLVLKIEKPRVGLLSIGEEEHKGNELTRAV